MFTKLLLSVIIMFRLAAAVMVFPLEMRTVDSDTVKLIEFRDGDNITYVSYDRTRGRRFTAESLPYVTLPFGRMNVSMPLGTFTEIFLTASKRMAEETMDVKVVKHRAGRNATLPLEVS